MPKRTRDRSIKDLSAAKLLDDFIELESSQEDSTRPRMTDDEYINMMLQKEAERELLRKGIDPSCAILNDSKLEKDEDKPPPEIPEGLCPSCHYCTIIRRIGVAVYCVCANPNREPEGMYYDHRVWVRSEPNLECHKESPTQKFKKEVRQIFEKHMLQLVNDESVPILTKEKVTIEEKIEGPKLKFQNFVDEQVELVESTSEVKDLEESDVTTVSIKPPDPRGRIVENELVEDFLHKDSVALHKHRALETLKKYRREQPVDIVRKAKDGLIVSEKMAPLKRCETCYFCVDTKRVGGTNWCHCTHVGRTRDTITAASWVRSKINTKCWKREELL